jgi:hypothetical protein
MGTRSKELKRAWWTSHPEEVRTIKRRWRLNHPDKVKAEKARWYANNKTKITSYRQANKERDNAHSVQRQHVRYHNDPMFRLKRCLSDRVRKAIKRGVGKKLQRTLELVGCSAQELRQHLERLWTTGMSWDNYGLHGWHVDHIRPCSSFDLSDPEQQKACFHWTNLQPLWAKDNIKKGGRIDPPPFTIPQDHPAISQVQ